MQEAERTDGSEGSIPARRRVGGGGVGSGRGLGEEIRSYTTGEAAPPYLLPPPQLRMQRRDQAASAPPLRFVSLPPEPPALAASPPAALPSLSGPLSPLPSRIHQG